MVTSKEEDEVEDAREMVSGVDKTGAVSSTMSSVGKMGSVSMTITWLIIAMNAIVSGLHTDDYIANQFSTWFAIFDQLIVIVWVAELVLHADDHQRAWGSRLLVLDFIIVLACLPQPWLHLLSSTVDRRQATRVLLTVRSLRTLTALRFLRFTRTLVIRLLAAAPLLLFLCCLIVAMAVPVAAAGVFLLGSYTDALVDLPAALYQLYVCMTGAKCDVNEATWSDHYMTSLFVTSQQAVRMFVTIYFMLVFVICFVVGINMMTSLTAANIVTAMVANTSSGDASSEHSSIETVTPKSKDESQSSPTGKGGRKLKEQHSQLDKDMIDIYETVMRMLTANVKEYVDIKQTLREVYKDVERLNELSDDDKIHEVKVRQQAQQERHLCGLSQHFHSSQDNCSPPQQEQHSQLQYGDMLTILADVFADVTSHRATDISLVSDALSGCLPPHPQLSR